MSHLADLLPIAILLPIIGAVAAWLAGVKRHSLAPKIALATSLATCGLMLVLAGEFVLGDAAPLNGSQESNLHSFWKIDGLNLWLLLLTVVLSLSAVLVSWESIRERVDKFFALLLVVEAGLLGLYATTNLVVLFVCLEMTRLSMFFLIGRWGGIERRQAATKFFLFTLTGGGLIMLGLMLTVLSHHWMSGDSQFTLSISRLTAEIPQLVVANSQNSEYWAAASPWITALLLVGFAIHIPLFPLHTWWQPTDIEAPMAGSLILCGVWLKLGIYGLLRLVLPIFPTVTAEIAQWVCLLAAAGTVYCALLALVQDDFKRLTANLTLSQVCLVVLGLFSLNEVGISGALLQVCSHGLAMGLWICLVDMLFQRYRTRLLEGYGGLAGRFPRMTVLMFLATLSLIALPLTGGFVSWTMTLMGAARLHPGYAVCGLISLVLSTWCIARVLQRTFFGKFRVPLVRRREWQAGDLQREENVGDLSFRELMATLPLAAGILLMGLLPQTFLSPVESSVQRTVLHFDRRLGDANPTEVALSQEKASDMERTLEKSADQSRVAGRM